MDFTLTVSLLFASCHVVASLSATGNPVFPHALARKKFVGKAVAFILDKNESTTCAEQEVELSACSAKLLESSEELVKIQAALAEHAPEQPTLEWVQQHRAARSTRLDPDDLQEQVRDLVLQLAEARLDARGNAATVKKSVADQTLEQDFARQIETLKERIEEEKAQSAAKTRELAEAKLRMQELEANGTQRLQDGSTMEDVSMSRLVSDLHARIRKQEARNEQQAKQLAKVSKENAELEKRQGEQQDFKHRLDNMMNRVAKEEAQNEDQEKELNKVRNQLVKHDDAERLREVDIKAQERELNKIRQQLMSEQRAQESGNKLATKSFQMKEVLHNKTKGGIEGKWMDKLEIFSDEVSLQSLKRQLAQKDELLKAAAQALRERGDKLEALEKAHNETMKALKESKEKQEENQKKLNDIMKQVEDELQKSSTSLAESSRVNLNSSFQEDVQLRIGRAIQSEIQSKLLNVTAALNRSDYDIEDNNASTSNQVQIQPKLRKSAASEVLNLQAKPQKAIQHNATTEGDIQRRIDVAVQALADRTNKLEVERADLQSKLKKVTTELEKCNYKPEENREEMKRDATKEGDIQQRIDDAVQASFARQAKKFDLERAEMQSKLQNLTDALERNDRQAEESRTIMQHDEATETETQRRIDDAVHASFAHQAEKFESERAGMQSKLQNLTDELEYSKHHAAEDREVVQHNMSQEQDIQRHVDDAVRARLADQAKKFDSERAEMQSKLQNLTAALEKSEHQGEEKREGRRQDAATNEEIQRRIDDAVQARLADQAKKFDSERAEMQSKLQNLTSALEESERQADDERERGQRDSATNKDIQGRIDEAVQANLTDDATKFDSERAELQSKIKDLSAALNKSDHQAEEYSSMLIARERDMEKLKSEVKAVVKTAQKKAEKAHDCPWYNPICHL